MEPDLNSYDHIIVAFSGGKDSLACVLHLLDLGVRRSKIELWHHDVDGREGSQLMDWPVTRDYCRAVAEALEIPLYFSWKVGGFEREMTRNGTATAPTRYEAPMGDGHRRTGTYEAGGNGPPGTRLKFPQVAGDLKVRWCSAYLKIDVGSTALRNQERFVGARTLFVTGERAEESPGFLKALKRWHADGRREARPDPANFVGRASYATFEPHRSCTAKRLVDQWRPVHKWSEEDVWEIIKRYRINPHPAYHLGFGRVSCAACIFGNEDQFATLREVNPEQFERVAAYEEAFGVTIKRKGGSLRVLVEEGQPYPAVTREMARLACSEKYTEPVFVSHWTLPAGAYGDSCGPT